MKNKKIITSMPLLIITVVISISCNTMAANGKNTKPESEPNEKVEEIKSDVTYYGRDNEVQLFNIEGKDYYILGGNDVHKMDIKEIKASSINTSIIKVNKETINGKNGITLKYYDIKIFLEEKNPDGTTLVGIYEPQKSAWTLGEDISKSVKSISIKLSKGTAGPITINPSSISMSYN